MHWDRQGLDEGAHSLKPVGRFAYKRIHLWHGLGVAESFLDYGNAKVADTTTKQFSIWLRLPSVLTRIEPVRTG